MYVGSWNEKKKTNDAGGTYTKLANYKQITLFWYF